MFGLKLFVKAKEKKFATDKDRKQHFAIQGYYRKKSEGTKTRASKPKTNKKQ